MNTRTAQRTILGMLAVLAVIRIVQRSRIEGEQLVEARELFGAVGVAIVLGLIAEALPSTAAALAVTAAITGTVQAGPDLFRRTLLGAPPGTVGGSPDAIYANRTPRPLIP